MPEASLPALALRLAVSMGVVIGLMLLAARLLKRAQAMAAGTAGGRGDRRGDRRAKVVRVPIAVSTIAPLSRGASVAIVRAAGRELVLGVTETQVTLLHSGVDADAEDVEDARVVDVAEAGARMLDPLAADTTATLSPQVPADLGTAPSTSAARIAADGVTRPAGALDRSAWTDALETLRAMTVRR